jgi:hypothetical protein
LTPRAFNGLSFKNPVGDRASSFGQPMHAPFQEGNLITPPPSSNNTPSVQQASSTDPIHTTDKPKPIVIRHPMRKKRQAKATCKEGSERKRQKPRVSLEMSHIEVSDEDRWLLQMKDDGKFSWKDIIAKFAEHKGKTYRAEALQMRLKRLRDRLRIWSDQDVHALRLAHQYWEQNKFEIIADKVSPTALLHASRLWLISETRWWSMEEAII